MNSPVEPILNICRAIREGTAGFRPKVAEYLVGETEPDDFRAYRVAWGIYEHRQKGEFMIRVRIGAALATAAQLERIAELSDRYGNGVLHVTTRQDIQIHGVKIQDTPDVLESLLEVGLSSRGGGGNTVRNVTTCPRAGVCETSVFDTAPYAIAVAEYLLADEASFTLPRKFKVVFSACSSDCALASVADLGFFAHSQDGVEGFAVYCGGGLGSKPAVGILIEEFIPAGDVFKVAEAAKRLFDRHGDREHRNKARLRHVLSRVGRDEFIRLYRAERDEVEFGGLPHAEPEVCDIESRHPSSPAEPRDISGLANVSPDKTPGRATIRVEVDNGDIPSRDLLSVASIAERFGQGLVRTTQQQDLLIAGVAHDDIAEALRELGAISIDVSERIAPKIVACTGASTCRLGLCDSRGLAAEIRSKLADSELCEQAESTVIRISGCPNSCGQQNISELGLQGRIKRIDGEPKPHYNVLLGGRTVEGDSRLGEVIGCVSAAKIPDMLAEAFAGELTAERLADAVRKYGDLNEESTG